MRRIVTALLAAALALGIVGAATLSVAGCSPDDGGSVLC